MANSVDLNYVYISVPKEYIDTYYQILVMLADFGVDMLKDCKAACTDKNSDVIDCFNMFNSAVAAYNLGRTKLANLLINYIDAKIKQIYKNGHVEDIDVTDIDYTKCYPNSYFEFEDFVDEWDLSSYVSSVTDPIYFVVTYLDHETGTAEHELHFCKRRSGTVTDTVIEFTDHMIYVDKSTDKLYRYNNETYALEKVVL